MENWCSAIEDGTDINDSCWPALLSFESSIDSPVSLDFLGYVPKDWKRTLFKWNIKRLSHLSAWMEIVSSFLTEHWTNWGHLQKLYDDKYRNLSLCSYSGD